MIDSAITRAHACAAGAARSNAEAEALGRVQKMVLPPRFTPLPMLLAIRWILF